MKTPNSGGSSLWSTMPRWTPPCTRWSCRSTSRPAWRWLAHGPLHHHMAQGWFPGSGLDWSVLWPQLDWESLGGAQANHHWSEAVTNLSDLATKISCARRILGLKKEFLSLSLSLAQNVKTIWQIMPVFVIYVIYLKKIHVCEPDVHLLSMCVRLWLHSILMLMLKLLQVRSQCTASYISCKWCSKLSPVYNKQALRRSLGSCSVYRA